MVLKAHQARLGLNHIQVSILVVLEMVLKEFNFRFCSSEFQGFNPCCSGNGAESHSFIKIGLFFFSVSILVVLEMVLKAGEGVCIPNLPSLGFNPCCSGNGAESSEIVTCILNRFLFQSLLFWKWC